MIRAALVCALLTAAPLAAQEKGIRKDTPKETAKEQKKTSEMTAEEKENAKAVGMVFLGLSGAALIVTACVAFLFYFLPLFIAAVRGHSNLLPIALVNTLLGWTLLGWIACLIWAFVDQQPKYGVRRYGR